MCTCSKYACDHDHPLWHGIKSDYESFKEVGVSFLLVDKLNSSTSQLVKSEFSPRTIRYIYMQADTIGIIFLSWLYKIRKINPFSMLDWRNKRD